MFIVCLKTVTKILITIFWPHTAGLHQATVSIYWVEQFTPLWLLVIGVSWTSLMVGGFQSKALLVLLDEGTAPSVVHCHSDWLLFCLIVGIHASGISFPLCLLMLLGWSLMWIASLTLREYQWRSQSINVTETNDKQNLLYTLSKMNNIFHDNCFVQFLNLLVFNTFISALAGQIGEIKGPCSL